MKKEKMTVKEIIQWYKDQGITEVAPLFHDPVIGELNPDEVNKYHDELCELSGNKTITNPKIIESIAMVERDEVSGELNFELICRLPEDMTNDDALGILSRYDIDATIGISIEGELVMLFTEKGGNLDELVESAVKSVSLAIPGSSVAYKA